MPGTNIADKLELVSKLGEGAMGEVWTARHLSLDTDVAVKFISSELGAKHPEILERFENEARAAARIKSPHVVSVFDHGVTEDGRPYIVMELLEGETLGERLERVGWLSFEECARVVAHVARCLRKAHALGIVHRDIKPENIFLCETDEGPFVKLLDFGVSKTDARNPRKLTQPGMAIGTAEYMSREQVVSSKDIDFLADLWSLAVVAYELLTGDVPFTGDTVAMIYVSICQGNFVPPSMLRRGLPDGTDAWFARAFAGNPGDRFISASELAHTFCTTLLGRVTPDEPLDDDGVPIPLRARDAATRISAVSGAGMDVNEADSAPNVPADSALDVPADSEEPIPAGSDDDRAPTSSSEPHPSDPPNAGGAPLFKHRAYLAAAIGVILTAAVVMLARRAPPQEIARPALPSGWVIELPPHHDAQDSEPTTAAPEVVRDAEARRGDDGAPGGERARVDARSTEEHTPTPSAATPTPVETPVVSKQPTPSRTDYGF